MDVRNRRSGHVSLFALATLLALPSLLDAQPCTVTIEDESPYQPPPVDVKNVGQEIRLKAAVTGGPASSITWRVEGEVVDDYNEMEPGPFKVFDHAEVGPVAQADCAGNLKAPEPVSVHEGEKIAFFWREPGTKLPVERVVRVSVATPNGPGCGACLDLGLERNKTDRDRQPEDYYTTNHRARLLREHQNWHVANRQLGNPAYNGAEFFDFHRRYIGRYKAWRSEFGYPPLGKYDPAGPIPDDENGYTLEDASRRFNDPNLNAGVLARYRYVPPLAANFAPPPWFTAEGDATKQRPAIPNQPCTPTGQHRLADFNTLRRLGCAVTNPWHDAVHGAIGGNMGRTDTAPKDPVFWRWHNFVNDIETSWLGEVLSQPPGFASALPPLGYGLAGLASVSVTFVESVTGVAASNLTVTGALGAAALRATSPATHVTGSGRGPYVFTGFAPPGLGPVTVTLAAGTIADLDGLPFAGEQWTYTIQPCPDADGDEIIEGHCWPFPSLDNCPTLANTEQIDADDDHVGDACDDFIGDESTLFLHDDRFEVTVDWRTATDSGSGHAVPFTDSAGLFWFFGPENLEMLLKVLDACSFNDRFWVFYAATTDVELTVIVTDTKTGQVKTYSNPLGRPAPPVQDTDAFMTCP